MGTSNTFTTLAGGDVAAFAVRVRFFQRQGYDPATALSSGAIASTAGTFHPPASSGGHQTTIWIIIAVVLVAGIAATLFTVIPRLRRLATARVRPHLVHIWADLKTIATEPARSYTCWPALC